ANAAQSAAQDASGYANAAANAASQAVDAKEDAEAARDEAMNALSGLAGGTTGQFLAKLSNNDYDYTWITVQGGGDMFKAIYDPTNKAADVFNRANHYGPHPNPADLDTTGLTNNTLWGV